MDFFCFWFVLNCLQLCIAQQVGLKFHLVEGETKKTISDAHVFIDNSSLGTISDPMGFCQLSILRKENQDLIITHVLYETLIIGPEHYHQLTNGDTLELQRNSVELGAILLSAKRGRKWKKRFKLFKKTLLGQGQAAAKCKILNPEVLRFEEKNGTLTANAVDLLHIENDYLGYTIRFWLDELTIDTNGSSFYKGNAKYKDNAKTDDSRYIKRRKRVYLHSLANFLLSLMKNPDNAALTDLGYELSFDKFDQGQFKTFLIPTEPGALVQPDTNPELYRLIFSEFLTVKHLRLTESSNSKTQVSVSQAEQQKFGSSSTQSIGGILKNEVSRLYKIEPFLLFDNRGNIINKAAVREYGYWAEQRLATTLPIDYKGFTVTIPQESTQKIIDTLLVFKNLIGRDQQKKTEALSFIQKKWSESYIAPLLDILRISQNDWQLQVVRDLLDKHAPSIKSDFFSGIQLLWKHPSNYGNYYPDFKAYVYNNIDPTFYQYFNKRESQTQIRFDEIIWGGVSQDGIPPLNSPTMIPAFEAQYLSDSDVIFGLVINGKARAYPKRILAWHEFFTDDIGDQSIAGVYCTLCGTMIIYDTEFQGVKHELGTSGFLFRSNKLMYDQATQSLWSTILGQPVVGPLVNQNIELPTIAVETSTWGEWRDKHPTTEVLSIETGHERNYNEGEAYKDYFAHDGLMFPVPKQDTRLPNKARVLIPRPKNYAAHPLAISIEYLKRKRIHQDEIDGQKLLIITESNGASRVYANDNQEFKSYKDGKLLDKNGKIWTVKEDTLTGPSLQQFPRIPAHEAFWFAWSNVFPETRIIK